MPIRGGPVRKRFWKLPPEVTYGALTQAAPRFGAAPISFSEPRARARRYLQKVRHRPKLSRPVRPPCRKRQLADVPSILGHFVPTALVSSRDGRLIPTAFQRLGQGRLQGSRVTDGR